MDSIKSIPDQPQTGPKPVRPSSVSQSLGDIPSSVSNLNSTYAPQDRSVKTEEGEALNGAKPKPDPRQVEDAVKNINDFFQVVQRTLQFSLDKDSGQMVVKVKDVKTDEVIRQMPPEYMLKLAEEMDKIKGLLFEESA